MITVFGGAKTLAPQGLPFRDYEASDGFSSKSFPLLSEVNSELNSWLSRKFDWTSGGSQ